VGKPVETCEYAAETLAYFKAGNSLTAQNQLRNQMYRDMNYIGYLVTGDDAAAIEVTERTLRY
jgi:hypothetical protein